MQAVLHALLNVTASRAVCAAQVSPGYLATPVSPRHVLDSSSAALCCVPAHLRSMYSIPVVFVNGSLFVMRTRVAQLPSVQKLYGFPCLHCVEMRSGATAVSQAIAEFVRGASKLYSTEGI